MLNIWTAVDPAALGTWRKWTGVTLGELTSDQFALHLGHQLPPVLPPVLPPLWLPLLRPLLRRARRMFRQRLWLRLRHGRGAGTLAALIQGAQRATDTDSMTIVRLDDRA